MSFSIKYGNVIKNWALLSTSEICTYDINCIKYHKNTILILSIYPAFNIAKFILIVLIILWRNHRLGPLKLRIICSWNLISPSTESNTNLMYLGYVLQICFPCIFCSSQLSLQNIQIYTRFRPVFFTCFYPKTIFSSSQKVCRYTFSEWSECFVLCKKDQSIINFSIKYIFHNKLINNNKFCNNKFLFLYAVANNYMLNTRLASCGCLKMSTLA